MNKWTAHRNADGSVYLMDPTSGGVFCEISDIAAGSPDGMEFCTDNSSVVLEGMLKSGAHLVQTLSSGRRQWRVPLLHMTTSADRILPPRPPRPSTPSAADVLASMAKTYAERNKVYGSNYEMVAPLVKILFPNGVPPELVVTDKWHLFELVLVKLSRFAISNLTHLDSTHDAAVYCAMVEACILKEQAAS